MQRKNLRLTLPEKGIITVFSAIRHLWKEARGDVLATEIAQTFDDIRPRSPEFKDQMVAYLSSLFRAMEAAEFKTTAETLEMARHWRSSARRCNRARPHEAAAMIILAIYLEAGVTPGERAREAERAAAAVISASLKSV